MRFFEFYANPRAEKTVIQWKGEIAVIPSNVANVLLVNNYAAHITDLQLAQWNEAVDDWLAEQAALPPETPAPDDVEQIPPVPVTPPVAPVDEMPPLPPIVPDVVKTPTLVEPDASLIPPLPVTPPVAKAPVKKLTALEKAELEEAERAKAAQNQAGD